MEANVKKREEYLELIKDIEKEKLVYLDERGIDMNTCKERGWGKIGEVLIEKKSGKYYERMNIIAGYVNRETIAPMVFNGTCDTQIFNNWVAQFLINDLEPGQIVVMDNASFHKSQKTRDLIESVGCGVIFLPPYSPDYNPIEKFWANMKRWIKSHNKNNTILFNLISDFFNVSNST